MRIYISLIALFLTACDPATRFARVKPDESVEVQLAESKRPVLVDIYRSSDKLVEVQVFETGGFGPIAEIRAIIKNKRATPIQLELSRTYGKVSWTTKPLKPNCVQFGKDANKGDCSKEAILTLKPQDAIEVYWRFGRSLVGALVDTELRVLIPSADNQSEEIPIKFVHCNPFWGKCETVR
jgi:hypothetical protein